MAHWSLNLRRVLPGRKSLLALLLVVLLFPAGLWLWLSADVRDISHFNRYLEEALQGSQNDIRVSIKRTTIHWESIERPAVLEVEDIRLSNPKGEILQTIPSISLSLNVLQGLLGHVVPHHIRLKQTALTLVERKDGVWLWVGENGKGIELLPLVGALIGEGSSEQKAELPFDVLSIKGAQVTLYHEASDTTYVFDETDALLERKGNGDSQLRYRTLLRVDDDALRLGGEGQFDAAARQGKVLLHLTEANPLRLCGMVMECDGLPELDVPLSGDVSAVISDKAEVKSIAYSLRGEYGELRFKPHFPDTIPIRSLEVMGTVEDTLRTLKIDSLHLNLGQTTIEAQASLSKLEDGYRVRFSGKAHDMPVDDLYKYWPATLAPQSRDWATHAFRGGTAVEAGATVALEPDDFKADVLPDDFLDAYVKAKNTTVEYIKGFPKARGVSGDVHFTGTTMTATTHTGRMLNGTRIQDAKIIFTDLNHPNVPVEMDVVMSSPAADVVAFVTPQRFDFIRTLPLQASAPAGMVKTTMKLKFNSFSEETASTQVNWDKVDYDIVASATGLGGVSYNQHYAIEKASGNLEAKDGYLAASLDGLINGTSMQVGYEERAGAPSAYRIKGTLSEAMLAQEGLSADVPFKGPVEVDAQIRNTASGKVVDATLNLAQASVDVPMLGYQKAAGTPATLVLKPAQDDATAFNYQSAGLNLAGTAWIDKNSQTLSAIDLPALRYGKQDVALRYRADAQGDIVSLKGAKADVSGLMDSGDKASHSISSLPPVQLTLDVGTLILGEHRTLHDAKGYLNCNPQRCESANITARFDDKGSMKLSIFRQGGVRKFSLTSDDAGNLLRAFDAVDKMYGGAFDLNGTYDDSEAGNPLTGRLFITNFRLKDAPILGRILNLSSLTGLMESLGGQGISFDKLKSDIHFVNDVATIAKGKASGSSLGISMDGTINLASSAIRVDGSFAPAHMLNSFISKIPIIGVALAGGEGESVFAFNYGVRGTYSNPDVSVNPLSVLTPGFTRKFFDIFDQPPPKEDAEQAQKPAENSEKQAGPTPLIAPRP